MALSNEEILNSYLTYGADTYDAGQRANILKAMDEARKDAVKSLPDDDEISNQSLKYPMRELYFRYGADWVKTQVLKQVVTNLGGGRSLSNRNDL